MRTRSLILAGLLAAVGTALAAEPTPEQLQFFESKIRPILSEKCYKCHSIEQGKSKGGLALDTRDGLLKGGETGPGVKPGDPEHSLLVKAILYTDPDMQMPPKGEKLSDPQIADITTWVKMGAPDPRKQAKGGKLSGLTDTARAHWAFKAVTKPAIPAVRNRAWCVTPVDAFIMQKLEEKGMAPSPDASKEALLRRASYDLTGLPPSPADLKAFVDDQSPYAFVKVVDRLLASPAYGERWGRYWLDTARYADTNGLTGNVRGDDYRYPYAWTYRDWVVKAFNDDLPYDQFIVQQLAADKIKDNPTSNQAALGFLTVGERFRNVNDIINDRIDVVTKGFLGLTVACARCHDHMFDPIPTKDYYALHGVFASTIEPADKPVLSNKIDPALKADFDAKVEAAEQENRDKFYKLVGDVSGAFRKKAASYLTVAYNGRPTSPAEAQKSAQKQILDESLDANLVAELRRHLRPNHEVFGPLARFGKSSDLIDRTTAPLVAEAFKSAKPKTLGEVAKIYGNLFASVDAKAGTVLKTLAATKKATSSQIDENLVKVALAPFHVLPAYELNNEELRSEVQKIQLQLQGRGRFDFSKVNELELTHEGSPAKAMVVADAPNPHDSPVFVRGQAETQGDIVPRHFLEVLSNGKPQPFKEGSGRMELAQAIASKSNPLTARVMVNRVWLHHFGQGFVRTPDDLGTRSETPSHPELIDYLANYFMDQGWSLKKLHKLIMLSRVYQESSYTIPAQETLDPENRFLWRANVRRLDFESFRDSLLSMSGQLEHTLGGQPVNLTDEPYSYRRSIYGYVDRGNLPELMQNFDFSNPDMPNSARTSTIVPQQALFLMNSPMAVDVARRIIARPEVAAAPIDFMKVQGIYHIIYGRNPRPEEIQLATRFVAQEKARQVEITAKMKELTEKAEAEAKKKADDRANMSDTKKAIQNKGYVVDRRVLNPWETYAQALLFSNEASYIN